MPLFRLHFILRYLVFPDLNTTSREKFLFVVLVRSVLKYHFKLTFFFRRLMFQIMSFPPYPR